MTKKTIQSISHTLPFLAFILLISACAIQPARQNSSASQAQPTLVPTAVPVTNSTYTVERGEVVYGTKLNARISPIIEEALSFPIDGVISAVHARTGDEVQAGDPIADLDTEAIEEALLQTRTTLNIAQARLDSTIAQINRDLRQVEIEEEIAQLTLDRAIALAGDNPSEDEQYGIALLKLQLELAQLDLQELNSALDPGLQADVDAAELQQSELQALLQSTSLTAPFDGEITSFSAVPGFAVSSFEPIGLLADNSQVEARDQLRNAQMEELSEGLPVRISPANKPGESYPSTITRLPYPYGSGGSSGIEESDKSTRFGFDNPADAALFESGERVSITIIIETREDVLTLPKAAVRNFSGRNFVVVLEDGIQRRVDIILGMGGNRIVEIVDGVTEGQIVVGQ